MSRITGKRYLFLWCALLAAAAIAYPYVKADPGALKYLVVSLSLQVLFFSIIIHEICHGLAALAGGDPTAKNARRLTLNPIEHISLIGSIVVPLLLFITKAPVVLGWAKPVPLNPIRLRVYPHDQIFSVMAGPLSNLALAYLSFIGFIVAGILFKLCNPNVPVPLPAGFDDIGPVGAVPFEGAWFVIFQALSLGMLLNLGLAVFNLVPFPPLDGYWLFKAIFPPKITAFLTKIQIWGFVLVIIALQTKLLLIFAYPVIALGAVSVSVLKALLG